MATKTEIEAALSNGALRALMQNGRWIGLWTLQTANRPTGETLPATLGLDIIPK